MAQFPFSKTELERKLKNALGKTLKEVDITNVFSRIASGEKLNKGVAGAVVEQSIIGFPAQPDSDPDLLVDNIPTELKTTGIKETKNGLEAKEPMSVCAVSIDKIANEKIFLDSSFWAKMAHILFVFYKYDSKVVATALKYQDFPILNYSFYEFSLKDRDILCQDWTLVRDYIINAKDNKGDNARLEYPLMNRNLKSKLTYLNIAPRYKDRLDEEGKVHVIQHPRFRLNKGFVTTIYKECVLNEKTISIPEFTGLQSFLEMCKSIASRFKGKSGDQIAKELGYSKLPKSKNISEVLVVGMFGFKGQKLNSIEPFAKMNITCKTCTLAYNSDTRPSEDTKLYPVNWEEITTTTGGNLPDSFNSEENADYSILDDEERIWRNSSFRNLLCDKKILVPLFKEQRNKSPLSENTFIGFKLISFSDELVDDEARKAFFDARDKIINKTLEEAKEYNDDGSEKLTPKTKIPKFGPNLITSKDSSFFIKGTGADASKKVRLFEGIDVRMYKQEDVWIWKETFEEILNGVPLL